MPRVRSQVSPAAAAVGAAPEASCAGPGRQGQAEPHGQRRAEMLIREDVVRLRGREEPAPCAFPAGRAEARLL
eukprot:3778358-Pyramimonas_sp.AAC.1